MPIQIFPKESVNEAARQNRAREYREVTDALFFKAQRGEIPVEDWTNAVAAVKNKFPYVDEDLAIDIPE